MSERSERRRWPVGYDPDRERRRETALRRQEARGARTTEEQLALIRARPGQSIREVRRLMQPSGGRAV